MQIGKKYEVLRGCHSRDLYHSFKYKQVVTCIKESGNTGYYVFEGVDKYTGETVQQSVSADDVRAVLDDIEVMTNYHWF